eukprot:gnl/TRDRNA2_/TRDRNA2_126500_c0_seq1.p1 gnl/TRDRNA2_/TRDRNA2_126500_c0~~gnl/TRDRNA2_/TRDRNA2_126500_c0_seq1.p1  ORF type:complete len:346 (-),score=63.54 gnl/TRDRNA2_/TRDRNA2_126500_c0_seq1:464-1501(-)
MVCQMPNIASYADYDEEELQLDYDEKCNEVVELQAKLREIKLDTQRMKMRLQAASGTKISAKLPHPLELEPKAVELRTLLEWLAAHIQDVTNPVVFDVGFTVPVGGRTVHMQKISQWRLGSAGEAAHKLRLSVPFELQDEIARLLTAIKVDGLHDEVLKQFASLWDLAPGVLSLGESCKPQPAVLLAERCTSQGLLLAAWPIKEQMEAFHYSQSVVSIPVDRLPKLGDRVEVEYQGEWFAGVMYNLDEAGKAHVQCDVDRAGLLTIATLDRVRMLSSSSLSSTGSSVSTAADSVETVYESARCGNAPANKPRPRFETAPAEADSSASARALRPAPRLRRARSAML